MAIVIPPAGISLAYELGETEYVNPEWSGDGLDYPAGFEVRFTQLTSIEYDFRCMQTHTSESSKSPPLLRSSNDYWLRVGLPKVKRTYDFLTNCAFSRYENWYTDWQNLGIAIGTIVYDPADRCDYVCAANLSPGENIIPPSQAVMSSDPIIAARFARLGYANAFAAFDYSTNSYFANYNTSGSLQASPAPYITMQVEDGQYIDHVFVDGVYNIKTLTATVIHDGASTDYSKTLFGDNLDRRSAVIQFPPITTDDTRIKLTITPANNDIEARIHYAGCGFGISLGETEWEVETSIQSFSKRQRNETFGIVDFMQRGSAKTVSATTYLNLPDQSADMVHRALAYIDARPSMFDFNEAGVTDFDQLQIFGFYPKFRIILKTTYWAALNIQVEGLVSI